MERRDRVTCARAAGRQRVSHLLTSVSYHSATALYCAHEQLDSIQLTSNQSAAVGEETCVALQIQVAIRLSAAVRADVNVRRVAARRIICNKRSLVGFLTF